MCALPISGRLSIIADDLTGAMDAAAPFASLGHSTYVSIDRTHAPTDARVVSVNLATRRMKAAEVTDRVSHFVAGLDGLALVKSDSAMRGHFGLEARIAAESVRGEPVRYVVVCPAFPANGRTVQDGAVRIDGVLLDQTDVGRDGLTPIVSASVGETLLHNAGIEAIEVALEEVRAGRLGDLLSANDGRGPAFIAPDARTDGDLDRVVAGAASAEGRALLCGSAGISSALARFMGPETSSPTRSIGRTTGVLVITASQREVAARQVEALERDRGFIGHRFAYSGGRTQPSLGRLLTDALWPGRNATVSLALHGAAAREPAKYADDLLTLLRTAVEDVSTGNRPTAMFLVGGDTAEAVLAGIGARGIVLHSEPIAGVALGRVRGGAWDGVAVATKSGAFGDDGTLVRLYDLVASGRI